MIGIGLRVKSGFAVAVVLTGSRRAPVAIGRHIVALSDPKMAETRQPYHDGFGKEQDDAREIARRIKIIKRKAAQSIGDFVRDACSGTKTAGKGGGGADAVVAGLVVGSLIDPQQVGNPHIRAHASEGQLFRTVVEDALRGCGVSSTVVVEKQLAVTATRELGQTEDRIKQTVAGLGKSLTGPWRADEKAAAVAAWMALK
jgi:hypothetical protein